MNVTKDGFKNRQLHIEDCLLRIPAEQGKHAEGFDHWRIAENNSSITEFWTNNLLELILRSDNMNKAYKKVKSNKGKGGIDGMQVDELLPFLRENQETLIQKLKEGKYKPNPVRRVEIPKAEKGKVRKLGVPTVIDRLVQQAIAQILTEIYDHQFSESSFGFRPKRGQHDALKACKKNVEDGYVYTISMDLEKFFDKVNHSKIIEILSRTIKDGRVISLIHKYLNAGVLNKGMFERTTEGVAQGSSIGPIVSNVMLNELDKELERRGHRFVRFADDLVIFCKSNKAANRVMTNITKYIESKLFLKVNKEKTKVAHVSKIEFLGYAFYRRNGKCNFRVHPKSVKKMKDKIRKIMDRNNGWGNEWRKLKLTEFVRGWVNYFSLANMKSLMVRTDEWLRRRIRAVYWKQWKKVRTKYKMLKRLKLRESNIHELANSRKGYWRTAMFLSTAITNKIIAKLGYISMASYYLKVCKN
jgi:RNA-directed DNA polymerase